MKEPYLTKPLPDLTPKELDRRIKYHTYWANFWAWIAITAATLSVLTVIANFYFGGSCDSV